MTRTSPRSDRIPDFTSEEERSTAIKDPSFRGSERRQKRPGRGERPGLLGCSGAARQGIAEFTDRWPGAERGVGSSWWDRRLAGNHSPASVESTCRPPYNHDFGTRRHARHKPHRRHSRYMRGSPQRFTRGRSLTPEDFVRRRSAPFDCGQNCQGRLVPATPTEQCSVLR